MNRFNQLQACPGHSHIIFYIDDTFTSDAARDYATVSWRKHSVTMMAISSIVSNWASIH